MRCCACGGCVRASSEQEQPRDANRRMMLCQWSSVPPLACLSHSYRRTPAAQLRAALRCSRVRSQPAHKSRAHSSSRRVAARLGMPPRRSARVAGVTARATATRSARIVAAGERAEPPLGPLPLSLVLHILSLLPVDTRLLCAGVSRSWRAALEDANLWLRLDMWGPLCPSRPVTGALLRAAAGRAHGRLHSMNLMSCQRIPFAALLEVVTANAATLRWLCVHHVVWDAPDPLDVTYALEVGALETLLRAAPDLELCEADVVCRDTASAHRVLRNQPPFAPLELYKFVFDVPDDDPEVDEPDEAAVLALIADVASHKSLSILELSCDLRTVATLDALVDAALARRLRCLFLRNCGLLPASVPALARLIAGAAVEHLNIDDYAGAMLDAHAAAVLGSALRATRVLKSLFLHGVGLWRDPEAAVALLRCVTGHPSLGTLDLSQCAVGAAHRAAAGAALGALLAANARTLTDLGVSCCTLGNVGMRPLLAALRGNTHLRRLRCGWNGLTDAFVRDALLPAVRANTSLRALQTQQTTAEAREAEALVRSRADAG